ncbi:MarR family winged helix-turn-helix transcriptional regulator [Thermostaphylospora chromogena]|uniref:DNA-binding transcriptional regulator, MarR family n=1 Tax=Thermostaphylospora chromogena TaxID=35622 RepID=A0A1H1HBI7_9ACTN|nr:MarR family transcriptional regulator [Thermostaphylospora chromogena]SDR22780.1 DNA-binding transcriptional regulator, MarR family [Thermostaphylospora chromogena]
MNTRRPRRIAFLLSQLGSDASAAFERALAPLGITPSEAGLLRLIGRNPGISQKAVSEHLGVGPSRVVAVLDRLERQGHVERRRSTTDRRSHEIHLTASGERLLAALRPVAESHEAAFTQGLAEDDLDRLAAYLEAIAASRGLSRDVHRDTGR